ncbi:hypothetical protein [uncultured Maritimibacter sp.]|uniref:hypothetical protein n=1 Tax=uncultured Maritimibacter sp. TaxID=991866 RepID=UPI00259A35C4|nr:hypothetical protein [uncultured Maritimibacter sp.]
MIVVNDPKFLEISYVLQNLSDKSREDVLNATEASFMDIASGLFTSRDRGFTWAFYHNGAPAALLGARRSHGDVWSLFGMGTDDWRRVWRLVTLVARRDMMTAVRDAGAIRAHCVSPAAHTDTHKWLRVLGASHEAEMPSYGVDGADYIMFSWLKE